MVNWEELTPPSPPPKRDLPPAFLVGAILVSTAVFVSFRGIWSNPERLAVTGAAAVALATVTFTVKRLQLLTAPTLVLLAWMAVMAIDDSYLPESFQGLRPQSISDFSSASKMLRWRIVKLNPPVLVVLALCWSIPSARQRFREYFHFGDWKAGIRFPLPWWGVPTMPFWMFFLIGTLGALPPFLPLIDFGATSDRWGEIGIGVVLMIPVLAFANAFMEEMVFRIGLLPLLSTGMSMEAATIPAALAFGFVHFHGGFPSGPYGASLLSMGGFLLGYFIVVQKGVSGAVLWHMLMDVVVLSFVFK